MEVDVSSPDPVREGRGADAGHLPGRGRDVDQSDAAWTLQRHRPRELPVRRPVRGLRARPVGAPDRRAARRVDGRRPGGDPRHRQPVVDRRLRQPRAACASARRRCACCRRPCRWARRSSSTGSGSVVGGAAGGRASVCAVAALAVAAAASRSAAVGRVGRRGGGGGASAVAHQPRQNRSVARRRLRYWLRSSWATTRSRPVGVEPRAQPAPRQRPLGLGQGGAALEVEHAARPGSLDVFTCWPPGPPLRVARNSSSDERERRARRRCQAPVRSAARRHARRWSRRSALMSACVRPLPSSPGVSITAGELLQPRAAEDDGQLLADHALADLGVAVALRAERHRGVVHVQAGERGRGRSARRPRPERVDRPGSGMSTPDAHRWQVSRHTPTRSGRPSASTICSHLVQADAHRAARARPSSRSRATASSAVAVALAEHHLEGGGSPGACAASRPRPRWLPRWKTTPSARSRAAVVHRVRAARDRLVVHRVVGRAEVDQVGGVADDRRRRRPLRAALEALDRLGVEVGRCRHMRGLWVKTCSERRADRSSAVERLVRASRHAEMELRSASAMYRRAVYTYRRVLAPSASACRPARPGSSTSAPRARCSTTGCSRADTGGRVVLRFEDTDRARSTDAAVEQALRGAALARHRLGRRAVPPDRALRPLPRDGRSG